MPQIHVRKKYQENSYFHLYGRGNNKEKIFFRKVDYEIFRNIFRAKIAEISNILQEDCFSLLPNHYHILVYQTESRAIEKLMRSSITRYCMYMNKRYGRVGRLFQSSYRARFIPENQVEQMRQYILDNPKEAGLMNWKHVGRKI